MHSEIQILALFGLLIVVTVCVQAALAIPHFGLKYLVGARDEDVIPKGIVARLKRATQNNIETFTYFAPVVLLIHLQDLGAESTLLAAQIFLISRLVYVPAYISGVPFLRTTIWSIGFGATLYLYFAALL